LLQLEPFRLFGEGWEREVQHGHPHVIWVCKLAPIGLVAVEAGVDGAADIGCPDLADLAGNDGGRGGMKLTNGCQKYSGG